MPDFTNNLEKINQWWKSFREQLEKNGLDPNNPNVMAQIMIMRKTNVPKDNAGFPATYQNVTVKNIDEYTANRRELMSYFQYAFMEVDAEGKYAVERPKKGDTIEWMYGNLKGFDSASDDLKAYLYKMAKENRLCLRDITYDRDNRSSVQLICVSENDTAKISKSIEKMTASGEKDKIDCTTEGFTKEAFEAIQKYVNEEVLQIDLYLSASNGKLTEAYMTNKDREKANNPSFSKELKYKIRKALKDDPCFFEKRISTYGIKHPEWVNSPQKRKEMLGVLKLCNLGPIVTNDTEKYTLDIYSEMKPLLEKYEKNLKKLTGCAELEDVMNSAKVKRMDSSAFSQENTQIFMRQVMKSLTSAENGIQIIDKSGKERIYCVNGDYGLAEGIRIKEYDTASQIIADSIVGKPEQGSMEAAFDQSFRVLLKNLQGASKKSAIAYCEMKKDFQKIKTASEEYVKSSENAVADIQVSRRKAALAYISMCNFFENKQEHIIEAMSNEHKEIFAHVSEKQEGFLQQNSLPKKKDTLLLTTPYVTEMKRLKKELEKYDHRLSSDTDEYVNLQKELSMLTKAAFTDISTVGVFSKDMCTTLKGVKDACRAYIKKHEDLDKLSTRQKNRLKVIHRMLDVCDAAAAKEKNPEDCRLQKLASKLVTNKLICKTRYIPFGKKMVSGQEPVYSKDILLNRAAFQKEVQKLMETNEFKEYSRLSKERQQSLLEMNGSHLLDNYNKWVKRFREMEMDGQKPIKESNRVPVDGARNI